MEAKMRRLNLITVMLRFLDLDPDSIGGNPADSNRPFGLDVAPMYS